MTVFNEDTVKVVAEMINLSNVKDEAATALASDLEFQVRELIQNSTKFMKHSKRKVLRSSDINNALKLRSEPPTFGHRSNRQPKFQSVSGLGGLFYISDETKSIEEAIRQPLPPCPREPCMVAHWLAVEGSQPAIPQNPSVEEGEKILRGGRGGGGGGGGGGRGRGGEKKRKRLGGEVEDVQVKALVQSVLSEELQLYFETVASGLQENKNVKQILTNIQKDAGLQPLLPYWSQFIFDEVTQNLLKLPYLKVLMAFARGLLENPTLNLEPYLHQMMPPILTCMVGKRLSEQPTENHWELRDTAASIIGAICQKFSKNYPILQSRITKTLLNAFLDVQKPLTSHYGALVGLSALGDRVVQLLILPNLKVYIEEVVKPKMERRGGGGGEGGAEQERVEAEHVYHKAVEVSGRFLNNLMMETKGNKVPLSVRVGEKEKEGEEKEKEKEEDMEIEGEEEEEGEEHVKEARKAVENLLPEDWIDYYVELRGLFGDHLTPFLPPMGEMSDDPAAALFL